jgi:hypothetical protein
LSPCRCQLMVLVRARARARRVRIGVPACGRASVTSLFRAARHPAISGVYGFPPGQPPVLTAYSLGG